MSAREDHDETGLKEGASCAGPNETSSGTVQISELPSSSPKAEKRKGMEMEQFPSTTLEQMLMSSPFSLTPDITAGVLSSLAEASPSSQGLAGILPASFLSQLAGHQPEAACDAALPHLPHGLHSPPSISFPRTPLTLSQQTSTDSSLCCTPQLNRRSSFPDSVGGTPVMARGVEFSPKEGGPSSSGGKVSTRTTKRTRSDDVTLLKSGADTRSSSKRSKSESLSSSRKNSTPAKKATRSLGSATACVKDLGRWRPTDDLLLISAVEQTKDLAAVHIGTKFSCQFSLKEIEARWQALLYDKHISRLSMQALLSLQPGVLPAEQPKALWSDEEEQILSTVPSTNVGELKTFQSLLDDNPGTFHCTRTSRSLQYHWALMRHMCLLCDQDVGYTPADGNLASFAEWIDELEDSDLAKPRTSVEEALDQELALADRRAKREIVAVENDLAKWEDMLGLPESGCFRPGVLAVFRGQNTCFEMLTKEIVIGRGSVGGEKVNIDLMREVPNSKVSRKQAIVKVDKNGNLVLKNVGRRPVYVHGKPLLTGQSTKLEHRQVIEVQICSISLTVYIKASKTLSQTTPGT